jgi:hypothetical protein
MPFTQAGAFWLSSDGSPASGSAADTLTFAPKYQLAP